MKVTEQTVDESIRRHLPGAAAEGAALVGVSCENDPLMIVEAINAFIAEPPKRKWFRKVDNWNDRAMPLGSLWGVQMQRQFGWEWINMIQHDHDDLQVLAIFDRHRTVGVYPFHYIFGCLENEVYPTILLAFNMLMAGTIPKFERGSYVNLMDGVQHIVPPV
jgi:hypothetical protein